MSVVVLPAYYRGVELANEESHVVQEHLDRGEALVGRRETEAGVELVFAPMARDGSAVRWATRDPYAKADPYARRDPYARANNYPRRNGY